MLNLAESPESQTGPSSQPSGARRRAATAQGRHRDHAEEDAAAHTSAAAAAAAGTGQCSTASTATAATTAHAD